jgi:hypothetical protein
MKNKSRKNKRNFKEEKEETPHYSYSKDDDGEAMDVELFQQIQGISTKADEGPTIEHI